jgi:hypothetical protein
MSNWYFTNAREFPYGDGTAAAVIKSFRAPTSSPEISEPRAVQNDLDSVVVRPELLQELHCRYRQRPGPIQIPDLSDKSYRFNETDTFLVTMLWNARL